MSKDNLQESVIYFHPKDGNLGSSGLLEAPLLTLSHIACLLPYILRQSLSWNCEVTNLASWPLSPGNPSALPPGLGLEAHTATSGFFIWFLRTELRFSCLYKQALYQLSHFSSPYTAFFTNNTDKSLPYSDTGQKAGKLRTLMTHKPLPRPPTIQP